MAVPPRRKVAVLVATGGSPSVVAAKAATSTIPIIFTSGGDPVQRGIVTSLNRPGSNITGVNLFTNVLDGKRIGLLRALVPRSPIDRCTLQSEPPGSHE